MAGAAQVPRHGLAPLRQGALDALCGLYAAVNAVRLALAGRCPLGRDEAGQLFGRGVALLAGRDQLAVAAIAGMGLEHWPDLVDAVVDTATRLTGLAVTPTRPLANVAQPSWAEALAVIEAAVDQGYPVLVALAGWPEHYTVVAGYTPASLLLFDSGGIARLARVSCQLDEKAGTRRHRLLAGSLTVLRVD